MRYVAAFAALFIAGTAFASNDSPKAFDRPARPGDAIGSDEVTRIVVVGSRGVPHPVPLSADKGFIYDCRAYNGCTCAVAWLDAYAGERRVAHQPWLGMGCRKRR